MASPAPDAEAPPLLSDAVESPEALARSTLPKRIQRAAWENEAQPILSWLDEGGGAVDATLEDAALGPVTLLIIASGCGHGDLVKALLERRATVDFQTARGDTALMAAAYKNRPAIVRQLLRAGAQPGLRDREDRSAPYLALSEGHEECVMAFTELARKQAAEKLAAKRAAQRKLKIQGESAGVVDGSGKAGDSTAAQGTASGPASAPSTSATLVEALGDQIEGAKDAVANMIEDATNSLELATGLDLDGDGDIGLKGHKGTTQRRRERHTADGVAGLRPDGNTVARRRERNTVD